MNTDSKLSNIRFIPLLILAMLVNIISQTVHATGHHRFIWLGTILLGSIATSILMTMIDPIIFAQIDAGNLWFQPVIGYSLPVLITVTLTFFGGWAWARWQEGASK